MARVLWTTVIKRMDRIRASPKLIATASATALFTMASAVTNWSILPLVVVINSINHHCVFPNSHLAYYADLVFNCACMTWFSRLSAFARVCGACSALGWFVGQSQGGCNSHVGVWFHVLLCQVPGALGAAVVLRGNDNPPPLAYLSMLLCGWVWAAFDWLLLPTTLRDRTRVAWALVCVGIGVVGSYQGIVGYCACDDHSQHARIGQLVALQTVHELGSLTAEFAQRQPTNLQYCAHHVLFLLMLLMHRPEWHDTDARLYRLPITGETVYTERDVLYLLGCTELSSVFLQLITLASDAGWARDGLVVRSLGWSKPAFALTYIGVRILWWPVHAWPMMYRALVLLVHKEEPLARLLGGGVAACMGWLSAMQMQWGYTIMRKVTEQVTAMV